MTNLHPPINGTEEYLAAVHERLGETNELLRRILDRPSSFVGGGAVELREPVIGSATEVPGAHGGRPAEPSAVLTEPAQPATAAKPARRPRARTTSKKTEA